MTSHRKTKVGAAVTSTSRASPGTIGIEGGKGGIMTRVEAQVWGTLETIVNSGGLVELENDSVDWKPFEFYTQGQSCVTAGGVKLAPYRIDCYKPLPDNSTVTIYYTPQDNQSQKLAITIYWETDYQYLGVQTYAKSGIGTAVTQVTIDADHVTIDIPAHKGGVTLGFQVQVWGTLETVVNSGGLVALKNKSANPSWEPFDFYTQGQSCVTSGGVELDPYLMPANLHCPGNSKVQCDYTPQDNQSQKISLVVIWEG